MVNKIVNGFLVTSTDPIDERLVVTVEQMLSPEFDMRMPESCTVAGSGDSATSKIKINGRPYIYSKSNTFLKQAELDDTGTLVLSAGRFRLFGTNSTTAMWGDIGGTLNDQTDLVAKFTADETLITANKTAIETEVARAEKAESELAGDISDEVSRAKAAEEANANALGEHTKNKANPHAVTKAQLGLGNVDNTSDVNKPVSTAQQEALNKKVDKVDGKVLSSNDYTDDDKAKLGKIEAGAEVNVQSDWNITDTASDAYIKNKPQYLDRVADVKLDNESIVVDKIANVNSNKIIEVSTIPSVGKVWLNTSGTAENTTTVYTTTETLNLLSQKQNNLTAGDGIDAKALESDTIRVSNINYELLDRSTLPTINGQIIEGALSTEDLGLDNKQDKLTINPSNPTNSLHSITIDGINYIIIPEYSTANNGKVLGVVDGNLAWVDK